MRMKEICEKTGLTDRAVRLYISSGLLSPERSTNYSGYTSIRFSEGDCEKLEQIALLRRAGFGISDIREMQENAGCIAEKVRIRCEEIENTIKEQSEILKTLTAQKTEKVESLETLTAVLKEPTSAAKIPKEDFLMRKKDFLRALHTRMWTFFMFPFLLLGLWYTSSLCVRAVFADISLESGGTVRLVYHGIEGIGDVLFGILPPVLVLAAAITSVLHFLNGKRKYLFATAGGIVLSAVILLSMPAMLGEKIRLLAFTDYRSSFLFAVFGSTNGKSDMIIPALMLYAPLAVAIVLCVFAMIRSDD